MIAQDSKEKNTGVDLANTGRTFPEILIDNSGKANSTYVDTLTPVEAVEYQRSGTLPPRTLKRIESLMAKLAEITGNRKSRTQTKLNNNDSKNIENVQQKTQPNRPRRSIITWLKKRATEEIQQEQEEQFQWLLKAFQESRTFSETNWPVSTFEQETFDDDWLMISKRRRPLVRLPSEQ